MNNNRRKCLNLQVKRHLQVWLMIRLGGIIILTAIISALILYGYARHETINSFYDAHIKIRRLSDLLIPVVLSGCAVSLISGAIVAIFLPQKLAGPIYHIENRFKSLASGDFTVRIGLRTNDTLHNFANQLNTAIDHADQQWGQVQQLNENLQYLAQTPNADITATLNQLNEVVSSVKTSYADKIDYPIEYVI